MRKHEISRGSIATYSAVGARHELNQDQVWFDEKGKYKYLCVADGCSCATHSRIGALVTAFEAVRYAKITNLEAALHRPEAAKLFAVELLSGIRDALAKTADRYACPVSEFASTMLFLASDETTHEFLSVQLGDGAIFVSGSAGMKMLPVKRPFAGRQNVTYSTVDLFRPDFFTAMIEKAVVVEIGEADHAILMSDGLTPIYRDESILETITFQNALYSSSVIEESLRNLCAVCTRSTLDDTAIGVMSNCKGSAALKRMSKANRLKSFGFEDSEKPNWRRTLKMSEYLGFYKSFEESYTGTLSVAEVGRIMGASHRTSARTVKELHELGLLVKKNKKMSLAYKV